MSSIRRQITVAASPRAVWRMLTTPEGLASWLADEARFDGRVGGRVSITSEGEDGAPVEEVGVVLTWRPTSRLEIRWDSAGKAPTKGTTLSFNLARDGDETLVGLVHSGGGVLEDEAARDSLDKSWKRALGALRDALENQAES